MQTLDHIWSNGKWKEMDQTILFLSSAVHHIQLIAHFPKDVVVPQLASVPTMAINFTNLWLSWCVFDNCSWLPQNLSMHVKRVKRDWCNKKKGFKLMDGVTMALELGFWPTESDCPVSRANIENESKNEFRASRYRWCYLWRYLWRSLISFETANYERYFRELQRPRMA